ncbi:MAG: pyrroloquinoline quinone biosynthesis protein PqqE [Gluconacetobacter diazotrophicus]|nr:pyrroloquinoline quinone biosynthesis protein PqqE [Gluconacetobacter diazotrophicus]
MTDALPAPIGLLAELTHRCPLACPYCSNPVVLEPRENELSTAEWARVFAEAASLGVLQLHLSGGEPLARSDLPELTAAARQAGLYTNLITSGIGLDARRLERLRDAGLDHVQLSIQDVAAGPADHVAGYAGAHDRKRAAAALVTEAGLPLTINAVIHRGNVGRIEALVAHAAVLGAGRIEIAHAQYHGWALRNRAALMIDREQALEAVDTLRRLRAEYDGRLLIDAVLPDYHARRPKACMGGWGRRAINVTPSGRALPCHAAETIPGLEFWSVRDRSLAEIWRASPAFAAFRGEQWMREPCRTCPERGIDFGGCRCQALALAGDAAATDPACALSPLHGELQVLAEADAHAGTAFTYRRLPPPPAAADATTQSSEAIWKPTTSAFP